MRFPLRKSARSGRQGKQSLGRRRDALIERQRAQLVATEENLSTLRKQYQALFERTADAMMILENGAFTDGNPACLELFGCHDKQEFLGVHPSELSPPFQADGQPSKDRADEMIRCAFQKGSHRFEWLHQTRQGDVFPAEVLLTVVGEGESPAICAIVRDITERKQAEEEIRFHAYYDSLTNLPNRRLMTDRIDQSLASSRRHGYYNALLFVDLDRFKQINDSLGHSLGDQLLIQIAEVLRGQVREEDTVARFGGDEFVILLKHLGSDREAASLTAERMGESIQKSISRAYDIEHQSVFATSSIGIYLFPDKEESLDDIIKQADTAMYSAKDTGRNRIAFFQTKMQEAVVKRLNLEKDLREAVKNHALEVYFQPQLSSERKIIGVEALARWQHPEHGFIPPDEFIAIAEDSGIIYDLDAHILSRSIEQVMDLPEPPSRLSVNISPYQFRHPSFMSTVADLIKRYSIPRRFLILEITEGVVINDFEDTVERLKHLRALGIGVSLDDFGTGYSSLSYLKRLPIDEIKIDRSFIMDVENAPNDALLVKTIINIAHQFNLTTVAEGVENEVQEAFLNQHRCMLYQGFLYSRPVPLEELLPRLQAAK
ncbi:putative bifunctional diguanylate cyclase/phosphodiesterase [Marinobacter sp. F4206]|uniref:putative bifunctional diguanylate cyclase/phosphodiesterase n=1 Tax=Marinobacter sp. F4206 TaxID=2861777 RepID=UPI001C5FE7A4|nr:EAL domain-containing protein [Marinobacter sp. F4206]MBW4934120.1 EAL domain-containing protein [Marinobacter sp. F4206]